PDRARLFGAARRTGPLDATPLGSAHGGAGLCRHALLRDRAPDAQKNALKPHQRRMWCIPDKPSAEFVFHMEDVLEVYHRPYDPRRPVVCVDETFKQLIGETREPLPPRPGAVERYDHVYVRNGTASLFLACEPLQGWRHSEVTQHRRRTDWAGFIRALLEGRYQEAEKLVLVMDQLNTHSPASLYEAFPAEEAKRLADRLEIHHTPKHGSWLNMAEIELSALGRQCLSRRIAHQDTLKRQIEGWEERRIAARPQIKWQFTTPDARIKLRSLYPSAHARPRTSGSAAMRSGILMLWSLGFDGLAALRRRLSRR